MLGEFVYANAANQAVLYIFFDIWGEIACFSVSDLPLGCLPRVEVIF